MTYSKSIDTSKRYFIAHRSCAENLEQFTQAVIKTTVSFADYGQAMQDSSVQFCKMREGMIDWILAERAKRRRRSFPLSPGTMRLLPEVWQMMALVALVAGMTR